MGSIGGEEMIPIIENPQHTVGLMDGENPKADFIGTFNPVFLKEWAEMIIREFGSEEAVCVSVHRNHVPSTADPNCTAAMLAVSTELCDSLQVCVAGYNNDEELGVGKK